MFCPQCGAEYREGFYRCADCDADLVDSLPEQLPEGANGEGEEDIDLVEVARTQDSSLLLVYKSLLDGAEVPYTVLGERRMTMEPVGGAFGRPLTSWGAVILVPAGRAEEAKELLEIDPSTDSAQAIDDQGD
jgi:hypothetical protein